MSGDCRNVLRPGRSMTLSDRDGRVLSKEIRKNRTKPMLHMLQKFQKSSRTVFSINTIHKKAHLLGLSAVHKPLITSTISNFAARLRWCKARKNCSVGEWKQVEMKQGSISISRKAESAFGACLGNAFCQNALCLP